MKHYLFLILTLFALGCANEQTNNPTGDNPTGKDTSKTEEAGTENGVLGMPKGPGADAIIVGSGVRSREQPNSSGTIIRSFAQGELVKVIDQNQERIMLGKGQGCEEFGYYWYKVQDSQGKESWIYGKYIFRFKQLRSDKGRVMGGQELTVNGKNYIFQVATDESIGPSDEEGLTGCDKFFIPFLYEPGAANAILFHIDTKKIVADDLTWKAKKFDTSLLLLLAESEGGMDQLEEVSVRPKEPVIEMTITHQYQDGSSEGNLLARVAKDRIDVVSYENSGPKF